jgi:hypothetical protein
MPNDMKKICRRRHEETEKNARMEEENVKTDRRRQREKSRISIPRTGVK